MVEEFPNDGLNSTLDGSGKLQHGGSIIVVLLLIDTAHGATYVSGGGGQLPV